MAETIEERKVFSLQEVMKSIQRVLANRYQQAFWVKAEMNKLNYYPLSGHCYPELVEKQNEKVIAQVKCNLWKTEFLKINQRFLNVLGEPLKDGVNILLYVTITFDTLHGLSLRILDIDPSYSLGQLHKEKSQSIEKLTAEGILNRNKEILFPLLPKRIAVISVETSKGYADFSNVIEGNPWGYGFFHMLFPAVLQGDRAVDSIIFQLGRIRKVIHHFDVVAIIRGGGGEIGLSSFNNYYLAKEIAMFPIPVITGIGHATNETVSELVSAKNAITPTELADFLIQKFHNFSVPVQNALDKITSFSKKLLAEEKVKFYNTTRYLQSITRNTLIKNGNLIGKLSGAVFTSTELIFRNEKFLHTLLITGLKNRSQIMFNSENQSIHQNAVLLKRDVVLKMRQAGLQILETREELLKNAEDYLKRTRLEILNAEKHIMIMSPENVLKRGYSITRIKGRTLTDLATVKEGDVIDTIILQGQISSTVKSINSNGNE